MPRTTRSGRRLNYLIRPHEYGLRDGEAKRLRGQRDGLPEGWVVEGGNGPNPRSGKNASASILIIEVGAIIAPWSTAAGDAPNLDPPDADRVYRNYLETCRRVGVEPVPRDRTQGLMAEWSDAIARGRSVAPSMD